MFAAQWKGAIGHVGKNISNSGHETHQLRITSKISLRKGVTRRLRDPQTQGV